MDIRKAIFYLFLFLNLFFGIKDLIAGIYFFAALDLIVAYVMIFFTYRTIGNFISDLKYTARRIFK